MVNKVKNKLRSTSGESIAETLVAVLISAFALLMLAGTVNSASNLITKSQDSLKTYYKDYNDLASPGGASSSGSNGKVLMKDSANTEVLSEPVKVKSIPSKIGNKNLVAYE